MPFLRTPPTFHDAADSAPWLSDDTETADGPLPAVEPLGRRAAGASGADDDAAPLPASPPFAAHRAAHANDAAAAVAALLALPPAARTAVDAHGHTVLHVAALVGAADVVSALLAPPLSLPPAHPRSPAGWTPLDVAVSEGHDAVARLLAAAGAAAAKADRAARRARLAALLASCPDYTFRVKWELASPILGPLLRACAPGDTYTVTKRGAAVRVDGELRGLAGGGGVGGHLLPEWRRGPFSVVWTASTDASRAGSMEVEGEGEEEEEGRADGGRPAGVPRLTLPSSSSSSPSPSPPITATWALIDRQANSYIDLAAEHRARRARAAPGAAAAAALASGGRRTKITAAGARLAPVKGWMGGPARRERVGGVAAAPYEARVALAAVDAARTPWRLPKGGSFEAYLSFKPPDDARLEMAIDPLGAAGMPGRGGGRGGAKAAAASVSTHPKPLTAKVWATPDCPLPPDQLFALLDVAGGANKHLGSAGRIARRLAGGLGADGLVPVKLVVPLAWTVSAAVSVLDFRPLPAGHAAETEAGFFAVPAGCRLKAVDQLRAARAAAAAAAAAAAGGRPSATGGILPAPPRTPGRDTLQDGYEDLHF